MASTKLDFRIIDNRGPHNLHDILKLKIAASSELYFSVAFVTLSGLNDLSEPLRLAAMKGKTRFLTGLYQSVTEPQALQRLLYLQNFTHGRFSVRLSTEPHFHQKAYFFVGERETTMIIGSSNLTKEGLRRSGELCVMLTLPSNSPHTKGLTRILDNDWEDSAVPLSDELIEKYIKVRLNYSEPKSLSSAELEDILASETLVVAQIKPLVKQNSALRKSPSPIEIGSHSPIFYLKYNGVVARAREEGGAFTILKGSTARKRDTPSLTKTYRQPRIDLQAKGVLVESKQQEGFLVFTRNVPFKNSSAAACVAIGTRVSGRVQWRSEVGQTYEDWKRPQRQE